jgi:hypothetical protein
MRRKPAAPVRSSADLSEPLLGRYVDTRTRRKHLRSYRQCFPERGRSQAVQPLGEPHAIHRAKLGEDDVAIFAAEAHRSSERVRMTTGDEWLDGEGPQVRVELIRRDHDAGAAS